MEMLHLQGLRIMVMGGNQIRCYNCRGVGHYARNYIARPTRKDSTYLQNQLQIAQKEEARLQLNIEEYDLMVVVVDCEDEDKLHANNILMANLQQASISGTHADTTPVYDSGGSVEYYFTTAGSRLILLLKTEEID
ncbi:hypothetical protein Tco_0666168 [Tanacetum coccineum]